MRCYKNVTFTGPGRTKKCSSLCFLLHNRGFLFKMPSRKKKIFVLVLIAAKVKVKYEQKPSVAPKTHAISFQFFYLNIVSDSIFDVEIDIHFFLNSHYPFAESNLHQL